MELTKEAVIFLIKLESQTYVDRCLRYAGERPESLPLGVEAYKLMTENGVTEYDGIPYVLEEEENDAPQE
jgi:hypothetical protein